MEADLSDASEAEKEQYKAYVQSMVDAYGGHATALEAVKDLIDN